MGDGGTYCSVNLRSVCGSGCVLLWQNQLIKMLTGVKAGVRGAAVQLFVQ